MFLEIYIYIIIPCKLTPEIVIAKDLKTLFDSK